MGEYRTVFDTEYQQIIAQIPLPDAIAGAYEVRDCLRETAEKATYVVRSRTDNKPYILKTAIAQSKEPLRSEFELLSALNHPQIPRAVLFMEEDGRQYFIRTYFEGVTLEEFVVENGPMTCSDAIGVVDRLCDTLRYLHTRRPPVIHRDIKPGNIILTPQNDCALIDFGIARRFDGAANRDTVCMGTKATAAPEQFGYKQTDVRSDVYSTGVLLLFLLTGSFDTAAVTAVRHKRLQRTIRRCMRFDPADRYPSIDRLKRSLDRLLSQKPRRLRIALLCALGPVLFAGALALFPRVLPAAATPGSSPVSAMAESAPQSDAEYTFACPLIEQAVRQTLDIGADTPVTQKDLERVTSLLICGDKVYDSWEDHHISGTHDYLLGVQETSVGTVDTLADIAHMKNLTELALYNQQIVNLAPLKGLRLTKLGLGGNRIVDLSVLQDCGPITELVLTGNPISDISPLAELNTLQSLDLSDTRVVSIEPLSGLPLSFLSLIETSVQDYSPLTRLSQLVWLRLSDLNPDQAAVCGELLRLQDLTMYRCGVSDLSMLKELTDLSFLDLMDNNVSGISTIGYFPKLEGLGLEGNPVSDLSALSELKKLQYVNLAGVAADDYAVLARLPALRTIDCTADQSGRIEQALEGADVQINVLR